LPGSEPPLPWLAVAVVLDAMLDTMLDTMFDTMFDERLRECQDLAAARAVLTLEYSARVLV